MPIDSTGIESQIDSNLPDNTSRQNGASVIRFILKTAVRWVRDAINNNLSTWLRTSDSQPGGANADSVYRTGMAEFRGGMVARAQTPNNNALAALAFGYFYPLQIQGLNGGPSFLEFHQPGVRIDQLGTDTDGILKLHAWNTTKAYPVVIDTLTVSFSLANTLANRKVVLIDVNKNDHQFYGFGVDSDGMRYQIDSSVAKHIWYAGLSAASSAELMRLTGTGFLGIGNSNPQYKLDVGAANPANGVLAQFINTGNGTQSGATGTRIQVHQGGIALWHFGQPAGVSAFAFWAYGNGTFPEVMRMLENGRVLIGQTTDNGKDQLQINGSISGKYYSQASNPSSTDLPNGYSRLVKNTSNGEVRLWVNDGGTMKSTLLS